MNPTFHQVCDAVRAGKLTYGERVWLEFVLFDTLGGFHTKLCAAIAHADGNNLNLLHKGFPEIVDAYRRWTQGDLAEYIKTLVNPIQEVANVERTTDL